MSADSHMQKDIQPQCLEDFKAIPCVFRKLIIRDVYRGPVLFGTGS